MEDVETGSMSKIKKMGTRKMRDNSDGDGFDQNARSSGGASSAFANRLAGVSGKKEGQGSQNFLKVEGNANQYPVDTDASMQFMSGMNNDTHDNMLRQDPVAVPEDKEDDNLMSHRLSLRSDGGRRSESGYNAIANEELEFDARNQPAQGSTAYGQLGHHTISIDASKPPTSGLKK